MRNSFFSFLSFLLLNISCDNNAGLLEKSMGASMITAENSDLFDGMVYYDGSLYTGVRYRNTRHDREWVRPDLPQFKDKATIYMLFNRHTRDKDFHYYWTDNFWQETLPHYYNDLIPSSEAIKFKLEDFATIYDCTNSSYINRKSVVEV